MFLHVVRAFVDPMMGEPVHPAADLLELDHEFLLADLMKIERTLERARKAPLTDVGKRTLAKAQEALEAETPLREVDFDQPEHDFAAAYQFLTTVPQIVLVDTESGEEFDAAPLAEALRGRTCHGLPLHRRGRGGPALARGAAGVRRGAWACPAQPPNSSPTPPSPSWA